MLKDPQMIRSITNHSIDIVPMALLAVAWGYFQIRGEWLLVLLGC